MRDIRSVPMAIIVAVWLTAYVSPCDGAPPATQSETSAGREMAVDAEFQAMLVKLDAAQEEFHNGRPAAVKALWSHADDVTLAGAAGGAIEKGWERVGSRLDWASAQFSKGVQTNERIKATVSGDFAYAVQLEHIRFHVPGSAQESKRDYRVTTVFRREPEGWRVVHRQADTLMTTQTPR
jgi:ketosteroid isomerase-like protein